MRPAINSKGFTLIELMIVIAILAIIAATAFPAYNDRMTAVRRTTCQGALINFSLAMERFMAANNTYADAASSGSTGAPDTGTFASECPLDGDTKFYDLTITAADATGYTLRATPKGAQAGDGFLELTSAGLKSWDRDNSGSIGAGENTWEK